MYITPDITAGLRQYLLMTANVVNIVLVRIQLVLYQTMVYVNEFYTEQCLIFQLTTI